MQYFENSVPGRTIKVYLHPGDDVLGSIRKVIRKLDIKDGYVASGIGSLSSSCLHMITTTAFPPVNRFEKWEDRPLELVSVSGIIANGEAHLHALISDHKTAIGGHLEPGCRVMYLGEVVIQETKGEPLKRFRNDNDIDELTRV